MADEFDETFPKYLELNFILVFFILIRCLEKNKGYAVEDLMALFQKSDPTIRGYLRKLGDPQWIKKDKPFGSQKDFFIFNPKLIEELEAQGIRMVQFAMTLKKVLGVLFQVFKQHSKGTPL